MYYECNSKCNGMSALIHFSETLFWSCSSETFFDLYAPADISPSVYKPTQKPPEVT